MTDFRALCTELVEAWDSYSYADAGDAADRMAEAVKAARAALAQPAPPAEGEVGELAALIRQIALAWEPDACLLGNMTAGQLSRAAELLQQRHPEPAPPAEGEVGELEPALPLPTGKESTRLRNCPTHGQQPPWAWGCPECVRQLREELAALQQRHPEPVPASERLPGPEDCDENGYCWRWNTIAGVWSRQHFARHWYEFESHWLPANALPLPQQETPND